MTTGEQQTGHLYSRKFASFIETCEKMKDSGVDCVIVASPSVLGDNYAELIESLSRLAEASLGLRVVSREDAAFDEKVKNEVDAQPFRNGLGGKPKLCFYCGGLVTRAAEDDHFPIPRSCGGDRTVPCCVSCHDMKDRYPLRNWPAEWIEKLLADFPKLRRETRLFLAKVLSLSAEAVDERKQSPSGGGGEPE